MKLLLWIFLFCICSCGPAVHSFTVNPKTITEKDSVTVSYSVRGTPSLKVDTINGNSEDTTHYRNYILTVKKGAKEKRRSQLVAVLPVESATTIAFVAEVKADSLIAIGEKSISRWGNYFDVKVIINTLPRIILVIHNGITEVVSKDSSFKFDGTPLEGIWEFHSPLSDKEKSDHSAIPTSLRIIATIHYKKKNHD